MTSQTDEQTGARVGPAGVLRAGKYLTFRLGEEEFGIQVQHVREIIGAQDITVVPRTAAHLKGVINLRGKIIPVVDLRVQFAFSEAMCTDTTCIIVVQVLQEGKPIMVGVIVDSVCEVLNIAGNDIEDAPEFGGGVVTPFVLGIAKLKGSARILLKIEDILVLKKLHAVG